MSRQFDEYMSDKFELYGEVHSLVEPDNFEELMEALQVRDLIQQAIDSTMHDEDSSGYCDILQTQEDYIQEFLDGLGEFDNSHLMNNISYVTKKNGLRLGDLEKLLGVSAGYISRTAKENSSKKLSIDIVWKIARLFGIGIKALIEDELEIPNSNTEVLTTFLNKLCRQTEENVIEWESNGGVVCFLDEQYKTLGLITEEDDESVYHPDHLNPDLKWVLTDDIFVCKGINKDKQLVIIPFNTEKIQRVNYDFLFVWTTKDTTSPNGKKYHWEKAFYTSDDRFGKLATCAETLYKIIQNQECDAKVSPTVRSFISDYLK